MLNLPKLAFLLTVLATVHLSGCDQPGSEPTGVEQTGVEQTDAGVTSADQTDADVLQTEKNLSAKGEGLTEDAMRQWQGTLVDLKRLRQQYQFKYDRLTESGGDAWQDMRDGIEQASNELEKAIEKAAERFEQSSSPNDSPNETE